MPLLHSRPVPRPIHDYEMGVFYVQYSAKAKIGLYTYLKTYEQHELALFRGSTHCTHSMTALESPTAKKDGFQHYVHE